MDILMIMVLMLGAFGVVRWWLHRQANAVLAQILTYDQKERHSGLTPEEDAEHIQLITWMVGHGLGPQLAAARDKSREERGTYER